MELDQYLIADEQWPSWYEKPAALPAAAVLPRDLRDFEGAPVDRLDRVLGTACALSRTRADHHNTQHAEEVMENGEEALDALAHRWRIVWPQAYVESVLYALATHDVGHPHATFFADARFDRVPNIPGIENTPVEWHSAKQAIEWAAPIGFSTHQLANVCYTIWSSTFGAHSKRGRRMGLARIRPMGVGGLLMRVADVLPPAELTVAIHRDVGVLYGERGVTSPPRSVGLYLAHCLEHISYIEGEMEMLDRAAGTDITAYLGWRRRLAGFAAMIDRLQTSPVARGILFAELAERGYALYPTDAINFADVPELPATRRPMAIMVTAVVDPGERFGTDAEAMYTSSVTHLQDLELLVRYIGGVRFARHPAGVHAGFASVDDALQCADQIRSQLTLPVAIGISAGDVMHTEAAAYGPAVFEAGHLSELAGAGDILVPARLRAKAEHFTFSESRVQRVGSADVEVCDVLPRR